MRLEKLRSKGTEVYAQRREVLIAMDEYGYWLAQGSPLSSDSSSLDKKFPETIMN